MRVLTRSACVVAILCIAAPASASFASRSRYGTVPTPRAPVLVESSPGSAIGWELDEARERIRGAREAGVISRKEARQLRREADVLARHADLYARDGLSDSERDELEARSLYLLDAVYSSPSSAGGAK